MNETNAEGTEDPALSNQPARERMIHACNFRYAGRLSNENARALTSLHEKLALHVTNALQVYFGASMRLKLISLEQKPVQDYLAEISPSSFLVPCGMNVLQSNMLMQMDSSLLFPVIDLLLGGTGTPEDTSRDLTDIDEDILESVSSLIAQQIERTWSGLDLKLNLGRPLRSVAISQVFSANEKLVMLIFELQVGQISGSFSLVLPTSFVGFLLRHLKASQSKKRFALQNMPERTLRNRMLDCKFHLAADVPQMRVRVKDLVGLLPGTVLRLNTAVKVSGKITVENTELFEALPVRSGPLKAAQIVSRLSEPSLQKD